MSKYKDSFGARGTFDTGSGEAVIYRLNKLIEDRVGHVDRLPFSIKIMLENALRNLDGDLVKEEDVVNLASWDYNKPMDVEVPYIPARVILQDFTGVPAIVDLAALRSAMARMGGDPQNINPLIPVDLVIDHSVQVDRFGSPDALQANIELEFERNRERYEFLRWGQRAFHNFRVVPPGVGIV
ncbi:MAG: aconitase family protein, partial [Chloroflexota bacterium]